MFNLFLLFYFSTSVSVSFRWEQEHTGLVPFCEVEGASKAHGLLQRLDSAAGRHWRMQALGENPRGQQPNHGTLVVAMSFFA